jgi:hypothetical protein
VWLDDQNNALAALQGWSGLIRAGFEGTFETLYNTQDEVQSARAAGLAKQLIHHPTGDLIFKNVTVFDSATAKNVPTQRVTVRGEKIVSVEAESGQATPVGAQVIDGTGKVLLPGLWDMHQHLYPDNAFLDVARQARGGNRPEFAAGESVHRAAEGAPHGY